jgi:hypothetical protein
MIKGISSALVAVMMITSWTSSAAAHISPQQRYSDGYNTGQNYAACDYSNCDGSKHGYDTDCPNDKKHTYEFCQGYSLGYNSEWSSLDGPSQQQSQAQTQGGSSVHIDGDHNTVIIAPRQNQEESSSESNSQSFDDNEDSNYR